MEIELVTEAEALDRPAGRGRDDPNQNPTLDPPKSVLFCFCASFIDIVAGERFCSCLIILQLYESDHSYDNSWSWTVGVTIFSYFL